MIPAGYELPSPQYDERLPRSERRAVKRAVRRVQGINPRIISATLTEEGTVEVRCGGINMGNTLVLKSDGSDWSVVSNERWKLQ